VSLAVVQSSLATSLARHGRRMGLWILLLVAGDNGQYTWQLFNYIDASRNNYFS